MSRVIDAKVTEKARWELYKQHQGFHLPRMYNR